MMIDAVVWLALAKTCHVQFRVVVDAIRELMEQQAKPKRSLGFCER